MQYASGHCHWSSYMELANCIIVKTLIDTFTWQKRKKTKKKLKKYDFLIRKWDLNNDKLMDGDLNIIIYN
jgi:hypothetical protein